MKAVFHPPVLLMHGKRGQKGVYRPFIEHQRRRPAPTLNGELLNHFNETAGASEAERPRISLAGDKP
jgi:hypothetical protein